MHEVASDMRRENYLMRRSGRGRWELWIGLHGCCALRGFCACEIVTGCGWLNTLAGFWLFGSCSSSSSSSSSSSTYCELADFYASDEKWHAKVRCMKTWAVRKRREWWAHISEFRETTVRCSRNPNPAEDKCLELILKMVLIKEQHTLAWWGSAGWIW